MNAPLPHPSPEKPTLSRAGRFYITRELGRGTVGCVYLAHDPVIGRDVALKTLNLRLPSVERSRQTNLLINEARAAGRLCHPHIVTVYDASSEGNTPYIAMEYLQGRELHRILADGHSYKPDDVASIGWKLADALDHAHRNGVVHRDIKPSNIFVIRDDQPKLMDFGIARAPNRVGKEESEDDGYTMFRPNSRLGTPNYMSPEQAQGKPADERSDIYSLGAVLYEMLTGRTPFEEENPDKLLQQIAYKAPPALYEVKPDLPPTLAQIVTKAMSKRPEKRYQDAQQMALDLKRHLLRERAERRRRSIASAAPAASPDSGPDVAPVGAGPRRLWLVAASVLLVTLAVLVAAGV
jgi:serine/threonine protein kinase